VFASCTAEPNSSTSKQYPRHVGDITFDPSMDDPSFQLCRSERHVIQYFNNSGGVEYRGEKIGIIEAFEEKYNPEISKKESGLLRIRFIVNCEGATGRFRATAIDSEFNSKEFDASILDQIMAITKSLEGWIPKTDRGKLSDYYQYLIFKIEEGQIKEILP